MKSKSIFIEDVDVKDGKTYAHGYEKVFTPFGQEGYEQLSNGFLSAQDHHQAQYNTIKILDIVYEAFLTQEEIQAFVETAADKRGDVMIKKDLAHEINHILLAFIQGQKICQQYGLTEGIDIALKAVDVDIYKILKEKTDLLPKNIHLAESFIQKEKKRQKKDVFTYKMALKFYPWAISFKMDKKARFWDSKSKFRYGVHVWDSYLNSIAQEFMNDLNHEDILPTEETIFVTENSLDPEVRNKLDEQYTYVSDYNRLIGHFPAGYYRKEILPSVKKLAQAFLKLNSRHHLVMKRQIGFVRNYIFWTLFYAQYEVPTFLSTFEPGSPARIFLQKQNGSKSIFLCVTTNEFLNEIDGKKDQSVLYYSFLCHDVFISSKLSIEFFKANLNYIGDYVDIGVMLSSIVDEVKNDAMTQKRIRQDLAISENNEVVCYCDSAFNDDKYAWYSLEEGEQALKDILTLVDKYENMIVLCRARFRYHKLPKDSLFARTAQEMMDHPRIRYLPQVKTPHRTVELMGIADLVISLATSSSGYEPIPAGLKSIYYSPTDKFQHPDFSINKIPNFYAVGVEALDKLCMHWFQNDMSEEFQTSFKKCVDTYGDAKALQRLKELLEKIAKEPNYKIVVSQEIQDLAKQA